jgi:hypothetical protein
MRIIKGGTNFLSDFLEGRKRERRPSRNATLRRGCFEI